LPASSWSPEEDPKASAIERRKFARRWRVERDLKLLSGTAEEAGEARGPRRLCFKTKHAVSSPASLDPGEAAFRAPRPIS